MGDAHYGEDEVDLELMLAAHPLEVINSHKERTMADGTRDNTNSGVVFPPHQDQSLMGQGKINIDGKENRFIVVFEKVSADKPPVRVLYEKCGVLFDNDKKGNDKAPDFSGPLERFPNKRIAGWKGMKEGKPYLSFKVSDKQSNGGGASGPADASNGWGDTPSTTGSDINDDIPF